MSENPLLNWTDLPDYAAIAAEHVEPAVTAVLEQCEADFKAVEAVPEPTWESIMRPIEAIDDRLGLVWGVVGHLHSVRDDEALREAHMRCQPLIVAFSNKMGQSQALYQAMTALRESQDYDSWEPARQRILESSLRSAELSGVGLEGAAKGRFSEIAKELAESSTTFANNVLDDTKAFGLRLTKKEEVAGLGEAWLGLAADTARQRGDADASAEDGPWMVTLDMPSYLPFMKQAQNRALREQLQRAFVTRASRGDTDNGDLMLKILRLRKEKADLLGRGSFAEISLEQKMAEGVKAVDQLSQELLVAAKPGAEREREELIALAREAGAPEADDFKPWDQQFWAERLREQRYDIKDDELRPYFALDNVLDGLFALVNRLFGIRVELSQEPVSVWNEDVRYYHILDEHDQPLASFFLDAYSRPEEKRGGAWMNSLVGRSDHLGSNGSTRLPVAYIVCNQSRPVGDTPSLMTFREVETLFHEFGHGLQHMCTTIGESMAAGISNVEWDAVELASQFMENWCYHAPTLKGLTKHYQTGEALDDATIARLLSTRTYLQGTMTLTQLYYGMTDMELHHRFDPEASESPISVQHRIGAEVLVSPPQDYDRFLCAFSHIFAGGYAAGYYSYKWAEVLSADAFAAFEEVGLDDQKAVTDTGIRFRDTVLGLGGSVHPMEVFKQFRGRGPNTAALLRHNGLLA